MKWTKSSALPLNDGHEIPMLGFGVYESPAGEATQNAVLQALECGYRHVDTAAVYGNESDVGEALRRSEIPREEIFVTTKLWNDDQGFDQTLKAFDASLDRLGLETVDLYLIHWPVTKLRLESWKALCRLKAEGRAKSIGVSNFTVGHLKELLESSDQVPSVNQVELSPFLSQPELRQYCQSQGIVVEGYSPLTRGEKLGHLGIQSLAQKHGKSAAQIFLRWGIQNGLVILPKSNTQHRILENSQIDDFNLDEDDLASMARLNENFRTCWDPSTMP